MPDPSPRLERLEAFFAELSDRFFNEQLDLDYSEWLDLGEKHGLLEQVAYNPAEHGEMEDVDAGDMIYVPTKP
jgi:hypothetical protein